MGSPRQTLAIARSMLQQAHVAPSEFLERLTAKFAEYGATNHLQPTFDAWAEWRPEHLDAMLFPPILVARGELMRNDPRLREYMWLLARAWALLEDMASEPSGCRGDCLLCDVPGIENGC